jgi:uncharacterized protein YqfA (UPF0365 family)
MLAYGLYKEGSETNMKHRENKEELRAKVKELKEKVEKMEAEGKIKHEDALEHKYNLELLDKCIANDVDADKTVDLLFARKAIKDEKKKTRQYIS